MNIKNSKETILNQALKIFGRLGFHKTTMADIANASKRGRRTIYTYFKNKEEVYEAVVEREIDRITHILFQEVETCKTADEKLKKYINNRTRSILELANNYDALKEAFINNYKWVEKIRKKLDEEEKNILSNIIAQGTKERDFYTPDTETTLQNLMIIIKGVELSLIKENNEEITNKRLLNLQHLLLSGLKK